MYTPIGDPLPVPPSQAEKCLKNGAPADPTRALLSPGTRLAVRTTATEDAPLTPQDLFKEDGYGLIKSMEHAMGWRDDHEGGVTHVIIRRKMASRELGGSNTLTKPGSSSQAQASHPVLHLAKPFYRAYNYKHGGNDHFFTTSTAEMANACDNLGYSREGIACKLWTTRGPGMTPLYRWWNGTDHCYTQSPCEHKQENLGNSGEKPMWKFEEITGYILATQIEGTVPFYRMFCSKNGDHHYTVSEQERNLYISGGQWADEGSVGFVVPP